MLSIWLLLPDNDWWAFHICPVFLCKLGKGPGALLLREWPCCPFSSTGLSSPCENLSCLSHNATDTACRWPRHIVNVKHRKQVHTWAKNSLCNKWCWENWIDMCRKIILDLLLTPHTKINSKYMKSLNLNETIKIIEENIGSNISDSSRSNILSDTSLQAWKQKIK